MRLAASYGLSNAIKRSYHPLHQAVSAIQCRTINTKPRHERPQPVTEQINLRPQPNPRAQSIGILGAGITGLSAAWHLSRLLPDAKITLYEKQNRLGGWLDSEIVKTDEGEVLFEWGPRSLRPDAAGAGRATISLLLQLKYQGEIIGVTKTSPAALNRFIYYDGRLIQMPGPNPSLPPFLNAIRNGVKVLTEPIFKGVLSSVFAEYWVQPRPSNMTDESVGDFVRRRFGKVAADNIASAFFHGIYAGDLYKLSARQLLPALWHMETRDPEGAGILMEMTDIAFKGQGLMQYKHGRYVDLLEAAADKDNFGSTMFMQQMNHDMSVYTFGRGLQQLSQRIVEKLEQNLNIEVRTESEISSLKFDPETKKTTVSTVEGNATSSAKEAQENQHDYVVSTLSPGTLHNFIQTSAESRSAVPNADCLKALNKSNKSVTVAVVNLYYSDPNLIPSSLRGFGYLIPRSVAVDQNPERALGVIFSSETSGVRGEDAARTIPNPSKERARELEEMMMQKAASDTTTTTTTTTTSSDSANASASDNNDNNTTSGTTSKLVHESDLDIPAFGADSDADEITLRLGQDTAPGTKLTVMLGGHWWSDWSPSDLPTETELIEMARSVLNRHLGISTDPLVAKARLNKDCIPQYTVGYRQRMGAVHRGLLDEFKGRVKVAGPWWQGGVGVNDCVMSAHVTAFNIREEWDDETGLKEYDEKEKWLVCDRRTQTFTLDGSR